MPAGECSTFRIKIHERRKMVLELAKAGGTYREIAEAMRGVEGVSPKYDWSLARLDLKAILAESREESAVAADEYREISRQRFETLVSAIWDAAVKGDLACIDRLLKIEAQKATLLGLNAPVNLTVTFLQKLARELEAMSTDELLAFLGVSGSAGDQGEGGDGDPGGEGDALAGAAGSGSGGSGPV